MNLYYAIGGGLGHLTRAHAFLHASGIEKNSAILTVSPFAEDKRVVGDIQIVRIDKHFARDKSAYRNFLEKTFIELSIKKLFLDAFPVGIIGEFCDFDFGETEIYYVARLLRWRNYSLLLNGKISHFKKTYILEPLENEHQKFVNENSFEQIEIKLTYPKQTLSPEDEKIARKILDRKKPFWLIVHAGSEEETNELLNFAGEMREIEKADVDLILISLGESAFPNSYNLYPASILFPSAERIFTAGGFNAIEQTKEFRRRHFAVPFERRFDDQFARVSRLRKRP